MLNQPEVNYHTLMEKWGKRVDDLIDWEELKQVPIDIKPPTTWI